MTKNEIHDYCLTLKAAICTYKEEWGAVLYMVGGKFFVLAGKNKDGQDIISLKCNPARAVELREKYPVITPGYYLNKTNWNSIPIDSGLDSNLIKELISHSYDLVFKGLTKKMQKELLEQE